MTLDPAVRRVLALLDKLLKLRARLNDRIAELKAELRDLEGRQ